MKPGNSSFFFKCSRIDELPAVCVFSRQIQFWDPLTKIGNVDSTAGFPLVRRIALVTRSRIHFSSVWLMRLPRVVDGSGFQETLGRDIVWGVPSYLLCPHLRFSVELSGNRTLLLPKTA
jgi:hypothetical protein